MVAGHERAPGMGVRDSDIPEQLPGTTRADGERERAPVRGGQVSGIPAQ